MGYSLDIYIRLVAMSLLCIGSANMSIAESWFKFTKVTVLITACAFVAAGMTSPGDSILIPVLWSCYVCLKYRVHLQDDNSAYLMFCSACTALFLALMRWSMMA